MKMDNLLMDSAFTRFVLVVTVISIPGVISCNNGSSPVVRMCFNNNITVTSEGFATADGLPVVSRDCTCTLTADGAEASITVVLASHKPGCRASSMALRPFGSTFGTKFYCGKPNSMRSFLVNRATVLNLTYIRREDDDVCMKYNVVSGGSVHISCVGDDLPSITASTPVISTTKQPLTTAGPHTTPPPPTTTTTGATASVQSNATVTSYPGTSSNDNTSSNTSFSGSTSSVLTKTIESGVGELSSQNATIETSVLTIINGTINNNTTSYLIIWNNSTTEIVTDKISTEYSSTPRNKPETGPKNKDGLIAGVVVACVVFVVLVALLVVYMERKRRSKKQASTLKEPDGSLENPAYGNVSYMAYGGNLTSRDFTERSFSTVLDKNNDKSESATEGVEENGKLTRETGPLYSTVDKTKDLDTLF